MASSVFIIGPGLIGWNVLDLLVAEGYVVSALVRRQEHANQIHNSGARPIMGSLDDKELITKTTVEHEVVIHTATADHLPSVQAVVEGVKMRASKGLKTIYIHTSGTSVLDDGARGAFKGEKIYDDKRPEDIDALPDDAPHRPMDLTIVRAISDVSEHAKMVVIMPPLIYGINQRHKRLTIQIPMITRFAIKNGYAPHIGKGLSVESQIHVLDLARGYITLLHWLERTSESEVAKNPYFFCENGSEFSWKEVAENVGRSLHSAKVIEDPAPREVPEEQWKDLMGDDTPAVIGLNSRSRASRLRDLNWYPREKSLWEAYVEDELPLLLQEK